MISVIINNDTLISEMSSMSSSKNSTAENIEDCRNSKNLQSKKIINQPQEIDTPERNDDKKNDKPTIEIVYDNSSK
jgi:hypothetical protein